MTGAAGAREGAGSGPGSGPSAESGAAARDALAEAAATSRTRIVAVLAASSRDLALAEDALADAFERALRVWPEQGVPRDPAAWLAVVARNRQLDLLTAAGRRLARPLDSEGADVPTSAAYDPETLEAVPDRRLELLFACAHPALDAAVRTPLLLQAVLGVDAARLASLFAVSRDAMAQRLVRAKRRIRDAGIPFRVPDPEERPARFAAVLEAVYGAAAVSRPGDDLHEEARRLADLVAELESREPEALGLAALLAFTGAWRRRRDPEDAFVPLDEQDPAEWDHAAIDRGERLLAAAHELGRPGRFQYEAAIASALSARATGDEPEPGVVVRLHRAAVAAAPTLGARAALAAALGRAGAAGAGLAELDALGDAAEEFAPAWATRARLRSDVGDAPGAVAAYRRAEELTDDSGVRTWLAERREALEARGTGVGHRAPGR